LLALTTELKERHDLGEGNRLRVRIRRENRAQAKEVIAVGMRDVDGGQVLSRARTELASSADSLVVRRESTSTASVSPEMSVQVVAGQVACEESGHSGTTLGTGLQSLT
jgi:hypothetical protein